MYIVLIKRIMYPSNKFNYGVISRMTHPKTKLFVKKKVIIVQVIINSVVDYPLQNFRELRKYGNWPIVYWQFFLARFENCYYLCYFHIFCENSKIY